MSENLPLVTIIIPTRNEEKFIEKCLNACLNQSYPQDKIEIIVVDGMSEDRTREIVLNCIRKYKNIKLLDNPKKIAPSAMNIGIKESSGEVVVRVDGHAEIDYNFIENGVKKLKEDDRIWAVGGPIETVGETTISKAIAFAMSSNFGVGNSAFRTVKDKELFVDTVSFPSSPKKIYDIVGLYDEELVRNQDDEHNLRIIENGGKILLTPLIKSKYYSRSNFSSLLKQYFEYGFYKVKVIKKHPKILRLRHFVPFLFVLFMIMTPLMLLVPKGFIVPIFIYGLYTFLNLFFSISIALKNKFFSIYLISVAFICLHIGYGLGFLKGLFYLIFKKEVR